MDAIRIYFSSFDEELSLLLRNKEAEKKQTMGEIRRIRKEEEKKKNRKKGGRNRWRTTIPPFVENGD